MEFGKIVKVSGPLVIAEGIPEAKMYNVVQVSQHRLMGEIIEIKGNRSSIQVYEETDGIGVGEPVYTTKMPLSVELGPGLLGNIFDGILRPLDILKTLSGNYIKRGIQVPALDRTKKWNVTVSVQSGDNIQGGDIIAEVEETSLICHKILLSPYLSGKVEKVFSGNLSVADTLLKIKTKDNNIIDIPLFHLWAVRNPRPVKGKLTPTQPLVTGQRVIDTLFPVAKGGTACIPGPFGSGKTVCQHQIAKWADAEVIIYCACGERGNEVTDLLIEFPKLKDPKTGKPLMERTIIIANTSNMPVAAREASVYTAVTLAEYYRDMGYSVALMADSTSRWAEAMREISGRLEEMPGEEGYPAYLSYRIAEFYERSGKVQCLGSSEREGTLTVIGAVSPPGGDLSDPVVQSTLRVTKVFWGLEDKLAYRRHFPAINWLNSYSLYTESVLKFMKENVSTDWAIIRTEAMRLLQEESELEEIARLVGMDTLSPQDRLILESARSIREDFLHQSAFDGVDAYTTLKKQYLILKIIIRFYEFSKSALTEGRSLDKIMGLPVRQDIVRAKYIPEKDISSLVELEKKLGEQFV
ncbi:V-type ATP synthase subunit A [bacterium Unc6]|nr:V-type ATP synthase subunit A [bacterium Unc6]